jgi:hypothetical protein
MLMRFVSGEGGMSAVLRVPSEAQDVEERQSLDDLVHLLGVAEHVHLMTLPSELARDFVRSAKAHR